MQVGRHLAEKYNKGMGQGLKISLILHGLLICFAIFGTNTWFKRDTPPPPAAISVDLITTDQFSGLIAPPITLPSTAPAPTELQAPEPQESLLSELQKEPAPTPTQAPAPPEPERIETAAIADFEQAGKVDIKPAVKATSKAADIISDDITVSPEKPAPDRTSEPAQSTEQAPDAEPAKSETRASIAPETTTEIVTEADEISKQIPIKAARPARRPQNLEASTPPKPKEEPEKTPDDTQRVADDILKALQEAQADLEKAPQLTRAQQATLIGVIDAHLRKGWSFSGGIEKGKLPVVEMQIQVLSNGKIGSVVKRLLPQNVTTLFDQLAIEAANNAIERARQTPILLTQAFSDFIGAEGKEFVIVFNPRKIERKY